MSSSPGPDGTGPNVLIVEDNPELQSLFKEQLKRAGPHSVTVASDGVEALEVIKAESPDLLFLDLKLTHLDGREVAERAREEDPNLPIVVVSGFDLADNIDGSLVDDYLVKPIGAERLVGAAVDHLPAQSVDTDAKPEQQ